MMERGGNPNILMLHLPEMVQLIDLSNLRLYLTSECLLTPSDQDKLTVTPHHTKEDAIYTLARIIQQKGSTGIEKFLSALRRSASSSNQPGHLELLQILEKDWKRPDGQSQQPLRMQPRRLEEERLIPAPDGRGSIDICTVHCQEPHCCIDLNDSEFELPLSKAEAILCLILVTLGTIQFSIGIGGLGGAEVLKCDITGGTIIQFFNLANGTILAALGLYPYLSKFCFADTYTSEAGGYIYPPFVRLLIIVLLVLEVGSFVSMCIVLFARSIFSLEGTCKPLTYYTACLLVVVVAVIAAIASITSACKRLYTALSNTYTVMLH